MKKNKDNQKNLKIAALIILILALLGIVGYIIVKSSASTLQQDTSQQPSKSTISEEEAKREANIVLSKVKMNMTKDEMIAAVGQPHSCTMLSSNDGTLARMQHCSYGKKEAPGHARITLLDGKVWGMTYESGAINTDNY